MTIRQTSFELSPAGTTIPTTGVVGDGDAFNVGTNGTGATWTSDSTAAALADGSFCALLNIGATATTTHRSWTGLNTNDISCRFYIYIPALPSASWDLWTAAGSGITARLRINALGEIAFVNAGTTTATTTGVSVPVNTLIRIEGQFHAAADTTGTYNIAAYLGHSTTPITGLTLSGNVAYTAALPITTTRIGAASNGPINFTAYFDGYAVDDTGAALGPLGGLAAPTNLVVTPVTSTRLDVSWTAAPGALGYDVERDGVIIVAGQAGVTYSDTGLTPGQTYSYRVRSVG